MPNLAKSFVANPIYFAQMGFIEIPSLNKLPKL